MSVWRAALWWSRHATPDIGALWRGLRRSLVLVEPIPPVCPAALAQLSVSVRVDSSGAGVLTVNSDGSVAGGKLDGLEGELIPGF